MLIFRISCMQVPSKATLGTSDMNPTTNMPSEAPSVATEPSLEFSDINSLMCLLCARQFKTLDQLKRHNKESDLHKVYCLLYCMFVWPTFYQKNFKDTNLREIAHQKVLARKSAVPDQPKYRDRASERRVLFNQPDTPMPEKDPGKPTKKRQVEAPPPPPPPPTLNPGQDEKNVGNKLLKMMGWKEGSGLGTEGDGRVEPMFVLLGPSNIYPDSVFQTNCCIRSRSRVRSQQREGYNEIWRRLFRLCPYGARRGE